MLAGVAQEPDTPRGVDVRCVTARRTIKVRDLVRVVAGRWVIVEQAHPSSALEAIEAIPVESHVERIWIGTHDHCPPVVRCYSWATLSGHRSRRYSRLVAHDRGATDFLWIEIARDVRSLGLRWCSDAPADRARG